MQKGKVGKLDMDMVTELNGMVIQEVEGTSVYSRK